MTDQAEKILTISIPTYNRADYLDTCLQNICRQLKGYEQKVELIVSDNCSQDNTEDVVGRYIAAGYPIHYVKNRENIGMDGNIYQAFRLASGKYVWVFSDDDILLEGSLTKILALLDEEYGVIHVKSHSFMTDHLLERPKRYRGQGTTLYTDKAKFIERVNVMFTFVSGNIINKRLVDQNLDYDGFLGSFLVLLLWTYSAMVNAQSNLYVEELILAAKEDNTGGYQLCTVFGPNMNRVFDYFVSRGVNRCWFDIINTTMMRGFLPSSIIRQRRHQGKFLPEDFDRVLRPVFGKHLAFWIIIWPAIHLPFPLARLWFKICKKYYKLTGKTW